MFIKEDIIPSDTLSIYFRNKIYTYFKILTDKDKNSRFIAKIRRISYDINRKSIFKNIKSKVIIKENKENRRSIKVNKNSNSKTFYISSIFVDIKEGLIKRGFIESNQRFFLIN